MTREEMITYIVTQIQTDTQLIRAMRFIVTNNINNSTPDSLSDMRLAAMVSYLQS